MTALIYIPTKGRAGQVKTLGALGELNTQAMLVVEPQEAAAYAKAYPKNGLFILKENDRGIAYVRQQILDQARKLKAEDYWMFDDDIKAFYVRIGNKMKPLSAAEVLGECEKIFRAQKALAIGSLEYQQFAWATKKDFIKGGYAEVAVFIVPKNTRFQKYDATVAGKEDRDFVLQALANGFESVRIQKYAFACPKNGSNKGGLSEIFYAVSGKEEKASRALAAKWPGVVEFRIKPDGRPDAKIHWKRLSTKT